MRCLDATQSASQYKLTILGAAVCQSPFYVCSVSCFQAQFSCGPLLATYLHLYATGVQPLWRPVLIAKCLSGFVQVREIDIS